MAARGHFDFSIDAKNHKVLVIWDLNGYGEYEFDWFICDKVMACTRVGVRQKHNTPEIFKFRGYNCTLWFLYFGYILGFYVLNNYIVVYTCIPRVAMVSFKAS